jgi:hypothetical protein
MMSEAAGIVQNEGGTNTTPPHAYAYALSAAGALGVAVQNYGGVLELLQGAIPASMHATQLIQLTALSAGGICSGLVNFKMNIDLLNDFYISMTDTKSELYKKRQENYNKLDAWGKAAYHAGIAVFSVTGILFGLMAFTFAATGPLAILSVALGLFVAVVMTIQEIQTWIESYELSDEDEEELTFGQLIGKYIGHFIAFGNVVALSLLFTLSLAETLIALSVAANPAIIAGFAVAFTFGAFTEFYFYNTYLAALCKNFNDGCNTMMNTPYALAGLLCISVNALVSAATTYVGIGFLSTLLLASGFALPSVPIIVALSAASAFFAGSASFLIGMALWIKTSQSSAHVESQVDAVSQVAAHTSTASNEANYATPPKNQYLKLFDRIADKPEQETSEKNWCFC